MNIYFYMAAFAAIISLAGIVLLIIYLIKTSSRNEEYHEFDYSTGGKK